MLSAHSADFWKITLHNKNAYVPGIQGVYGSTFLISPLTVPNESVVAMYSVSKTESTYLNLGGHDSCRESVSEDFNFVACLSEHVEEEMGCRHDDILTPTRYLI